MKRVLTKRFVCASALFLFAASGALLAANRTIVTVASTVPPNGDVNPYGVAIVQNTIGNLTAGNILVSNFNNGANLQGTGSTIMQITPGRVATVFAQISNSGQAATCPGGIGLTTALVVLRAGWVIVGSLPTTDGTSATAKAGCLLVLDSHGVVVETLAGGSINGPWDMTALDLGSAASLFVTNVLNGTVAGGGSLVWEGTVIRINLAVFATAPPSTVSVTTIGSTFPERTDPGALVIGPTGLALGKDGTLYVADSLENRIAAIPNAVSRASSDGLGKTLLSGAGLDDPLGLTTVGNSVLAVNGNNGLLIDVSTSGAELGLGLLDSSGSPPGAGALFGLEVGPAGLYFVDDATNTLNLLTTK